MAPSPRRESAQVLAKVITKDLASPESYKLCFPDKVIVEDYDTLVLGELQSEAGAPRQSPP